MDHTPEEYGEYWSGAIRIATGVFVAILTFRFVDGTFLEQGEPAVTVFGYVFFGIVLLVCSFAATIGLAKVVQAATGPN